MVSGEILRILPLIANDRTIAVQIQGIGLAVVFIDHRCEAMKLVGREFGIEQKRDRTDLATAVNVAGVLSSVPDRQEPADHGCRLFRFDRLHKVFDQAGIPLQRQLNEPEFERAVRVARRF